VVYGVEKTVVLFIAAPDLADKENLLTTNRRSASKNVPKRGEQLDAMKMIN